MSAVWERLAGDTDVFAAKISFRKDPDSGSCATTEEAASWGAFQLWIGGENVCAHLEEGEIVDSVHWYLLPMIEWFAGNWEEMFHEERLPGANTGAGDARSSLRSTKFPPEGIAPDMQSLWGANWHSWWERHALQSCRAGGAFPDVVVRRWRDRIELSWGGSRGPCTPNHFRFLASVGCERLRPADVARPLYQVLHEATVYLDERTRSSQRLKSLRATLEGLSERSGGDHRHAIQAALGSSPEDSLRLWRVVAEQFEDDTGAVRDAILGDTYDGLVVVEPSQAVMMFGSVSPTISCDDLAVLSQELRELYSERGDPPQLRELVADEPVHIHDEQPWEQGQGLAEGLLDRQPDLISGCEWVDIEAFLGRLEIEVRDLDLSDESIRAVALAGPRHQPAILLNPRHETNAYPSGRRFTLAHELCHLLFDRTYGRKIALASGRWAPLDVERRANAFAAMILMPPTLIRNAIALTEQLNTKEGILAVARKLRTSFSATLQHLCNTGFLDVSSRDMLGTQVDRVMQN